MYYYLAFSAFISFIIYNYNLLTATYSDEIKSFSYIIGWYGMRTYTMIEMRVKKLYNKYLNICVSIDSNDPYISKIILLNNGNEIMNTTTIKNNSGIDETIKFIEQSDNCNSYDFIISEYVIPKNDITYVQITNSLETFYNINKADNGYDNLEKSDTHFLSPTINIKDKKYVFNLDDETSKTKTKTKTNTVYLIDNILFHKSFIKWYLINYHNVDLDEFDDNEMKDYSIQFFDNNMDYITLSNKEYIILGKTNYQVISNKNEDNEDNEDNEFVK